MAEFAQTDLQERARKAGILLIRAKVRKSLATEPVSKQWEARDLASIRTISSKCARMRRYSPL